MCVALFVLFLIERVTPCEAFSQQTKTKTQKHEGVEEALATMRAGGRRTVRVPPAQGFGDAGATLRPTEHVPDKRGEVPPGATLEYELELLRVSVPPS